MLEWVLETGLAQGLGIFFVLFVLVGYFFWKFINKVMEQNNQRESRYIDTIDHLSKSFAGIESLSACIEELRHETAKEHDETKRMLGRVLDRLPAKGG